MSGPAIFILGPTASGKTAIGIELARMLSHRGLSTHIISVDSRQVYTEGDLLSGKDLQLYAPPDAEPVAVYGINRLSASCCYSLADFQRDLFGYLQQICSQKAVPLFCGGSGLYAEAILRNYQLSHVPEHPAFRREMMQHDTKSLLQLLAQWVTPEQRTVVDTSSRKRIVRALEVARFQKETQSGSKQPSARWPQLQPSVIQIDTPPWKLREAIAERLDQRLKAGMIAEGQELIDKNIPQHRLEQLGMEYRWIGRYLRGLCSKEQMRDLLLRDITRLAKRQRSYFRGMQRRGVSTVTIERTGQSAQQVASTIAAALPELFPAPLRQYYPNPTGTAATASPPRG